ncbi:MAG TPA: hemolysin family protein [Azospirillaceae bacterium]|nr:hemolysin family protein [Azospirillaceae bacterium]
MMWELLVILALILLNAFFAMSEMAVVSSRRARLQQMAEDGRRGARAALALTDDPSRFLSTVQVGITLVGVVAGAYGGATLSEPLAAWLAAFPSLEPLAPELAFASVVVAITYLSLIVGELVPKRVALNNAERIAVAVAGPMGILSRSAAPLVWLLGASTEAVLKLLRLPTTTDNMVTEEEVKTLIAEGTQTGVFEPVERQMIEGVLRLSDRTVRSIMTPRPDVQWLDPTDAPDQTRREIAESAYSRYPVCRGDLDNFLGVVKAKDLLDQVLEGEALDLMASLTKPLVVHDGTPVLRLLDLLKQHSQHLAIVVDEYGTVEGIVTLTDILESIAGEMPEPGDGEAAAVRREDGSWLVDGMTPIDEVEGLIGLKGLKGDRDFHTLAGFVLANIGHVPLASENFIWQGTRFEVVDMDGRRIDKVLIQKGEPQRVEEK